MSMRIDENGSSTNFEENTSFYCGRYMKPPDYDKKKKHVTQTDVKEATVTKGITNNYNEKSSFKQK